MKRILPILFFPCLLSAQTCIDTLTETSPTTRFTINMDGTVLDNTTGLMWQRCSFGQIYNSTTDSCTNDPLQMTWQQALVAANNEVFANHKDWMVPNAKELGSIIEHKCVSPALNMDVFLAVRSSNYWSSTTVFNETDHAWVYQFADGKNNRTRKSLSAFLRLVRYAK